MHKLLFPLTVFLLAGSLFSAEPFAGTWKLNVAKSKFGGPDKPPKEYTMVIQEQGDNFVVTITGVAADGSPISRQYTRSRTGGEAKYSEGALPAGTSIVWGKRKADSRSFDMKAMQDGEVIQTTSSVVSNDGKTSTTTSKGTDDEGNPYQTVQVYNRMDTP